MLDASLLDWGPEAEDSLKGLSMPANIRVLEAQGLADEPALDVIRASAHLPHLGTVLLRDGLHPEPAAEES